MGIPSPEDVASQVNLKEEYQFVFGKYEWNHPDISTLWAGDYDGSNCGAVNAATESAISAVEAFGKDEMRELT